MDRKEFFASAQCLNDSCADFGWVIVHFLHSTKYGAVFWICAENSVDNTGMFSSLLSSAHTASGAFQPLTPLLQQAGWGHKELGEDIARTDDPGDIPHHMASRSAYKVGGRRKGGCLQPWHLSSQVAVRGDGALLSWGWLNTGLQQEVVNGFLVSLCLCVQILLCLLNCLYLNPPVFAFLPFQPSPPSHRGGSERAAVWCLVASWG